MHFAALAYVGESVNEPALYYRNNFVGSLSLLDAMRDAGIDRFVFSSTCATYGTPKEQPMPESAPQSPINPYGRSKLMVEHALKDYDAAYRMRSVALRYFNACGAHPSGEIGELHDPESHLIPRILMAIDGEIDALDVFGTDYPTPDGTAVRDYVHVCDLADAHVAALHYLADGGPSTALNLGTGKGYSVREVIESAERVTGRHVPLRYAERRPGDPPMLVANAAAARAALRFEPRFADIDTIVASAWMWHRKRRAR
jgi:UDP-glucose-4-epimerase GalE